MSRAEPISVLRRRREQRRVIEGDDSLPYDLRFEARATRWGTEMALDEREVSEA